MSDFDEMEMINDMKQTRKSGFSLVQVMIAATIAGGLAMAVSRIMVQMNEGGQRAKELATLATLRNQASPILLNLPKWLAKMRATQPSLATCIPVAPGPLYAYACPNPVAAIADPEILALVAPGERILSMNLLDASGSALAGTEATPLFYDANGGPCAAPATNCVFQTVGYFKRLKATGDPEEVTFYYKISRIPNMSKSVPMKPIVVSIAVGEAWKTAAVATTLPACAAGETLVSDGTPGGYTCVPLPTAPVLPVCTTAEMLVGKSGGGFNCVARPLNLPTCAVGQSLIAKADGTFKCGEPYKCYTKGFLCSSKDDPHIYCCEVDEEILSIETPDDRDSRKGFTSDHCGVASLVGKGNPIQLRCCK